MAGTKAMNTERPKPRNRRPPPPRRQSLTARFNLRLQPAELDLIRDDADAAGLSLSETVRRRYLGLPIASRIDSNAVRELRRQGGLLKHALGSAYSEERHKILPILDRIRGLLDEITL